MIWTTFLLIDFFVEIWIYRDCFGENKRGNFDRNYLNTWTCKKLLFVLILQYWLKCGKISNMELQLLLWWLVLFFCQELSVSYWIFFKKFGGQSENLFVNLSRVCTICGANLVSDLDRLFCVKRSLLCVGEKPAPSEICWKHLFIWERTICCFVDWCSRFPIENLVTPEGPYLFVTKIFWNQFSWKNSDWNKICFCRRTSVSQSSIERTCRRCTTVI